MATRFVDARGTEWEVWEVGARVPLADAPVRRSRGGDGGTARSLRFVSATQRRRLSPVPERWEALDVEALRLLLGRAEPEAPPAGRRVTVDHGDAMWLGEG